MALNKSGLSSPPPEWDDSLPVQDILEFLLLQIRGTEELSTKDYELVDTWATSFEDNLYENLSHLRDIDASEWAALNVPLRLRTIGRTMIWGGPFSFDGIPEEALKKRKKSRGMLSRSKKKKCYIFKFIRSQRNG